MKIMLRQISSETINPEIKEQTTDTNKIQKKTATLRKFPNNNRRFIPENPPPINSKSDNQRTSPRLDKSTDEKNDETLFILGHSLVEHVEGWDLTHQLNLNQQV